MGAVGDVVKQGTSFVRVDQPEYPFFFNSMARILSSSISSRAIRCGRACLRYAPRDKSIWEGGLMRLNCRPPLEKKERKNSESGSVAVASNTRRGNYITREGHSASDCNNTCLVSQVDGGSKYVSLMVQRQLVPNR